MVDEVGPLVNWVAVRETAKRPALMFGVSSDRIGTPDGTAYFATVAKNLDTVLGWPIAPYVGLSYGTYDDELRLVGGLRADLGARVSLLAIHDGVNLHPAIDLFLPHGQTVTFLWVDLQDFGVAYSVAF